MKSNKPLVIHFSLLFAAAIGAYWIYGTPNEKTPVTESIILDIKASDIERISYTENAKLVEITPKSDDRLMISVYQRDESLPDPERWDEEEPVDTEEEENTATASDGTVPEDWVDDVRRSEYRTSDDFRKKLDALFPLTAKRRLGAPAGEALGRFGFAAPKATLTLVAKGRKVVFEVGVGGFGGEAYYLRQRPEGTVYLVDADLIRTVNLRSPRYMEHSPMGVEKTSVTALTVRAGDKSRKLVRRGTGRDAKWAPENAPDRPSDMMANWFGALFRMSADKYLLDGITPEAVPFAKIDVEVEGDIVDTLDLMQADGEEGKNAFFAKSRHTGAWVELNRHTVEGVAADLPSIIEGQ